MVLIQLLGLLDILSGLVIIILRFGTFTEIGLFLSIFLGIKSLIFIKDIASILDLVTAIFLGLAALGFYFSFTWIFSIWLLQKGLFSLICD